MSILETLLSGQNGGLVSQVAKKVGIDESTAQTLITQLVPAVSKGIKNNAASQQGLDGLLNALNSGNHQRYLDDPENLANVEAVDEGNAILGHVFGDKTVSRNVAGHAAQRTGVDESIVKKLLPLVATMAMGALSKQANTAQHMGNTVNNLQSQDAGSVSGMLFSLLDSDNDGYVTDDLLNLAKKFF